MRLLGQFIYFFIKIFYTQKKPTKHPSNVYSDIFYMPKSIIKHTDSFSSRYYA